MLAAVLLADAECGCLASRMSVAGRLQQYARDARKEYAELGSKDLSELKSFVKGLPKLLLLDRLSDLAVPVAEVVKQQVLSRARHRQSIGRLLGSMPRGWGMG